MAEDSPLGPYRALDLTEGGFNWCGKVLADLGADVIKVEPPEGSPTRGRGPFRTEASQPDCSLYWDSYCLNKRGITLALEKPDGRDLFERLVAKSDFVLESFPVGHMDALGLGYDSLSTINPRIIMASMTPFGQSGPYARYKAPDLVAWAMGGMQYVTGDADRPPVRISFPQAELHAGAQAATGSMVAFWHRQMTGEGQRVDVSMQVAIVWTLMNATQFPTLEKTNIERSGPYNESRPLAIRAVFPCKDGFISVTVAGGAHGDGMAALVRWMDEEGVAPDFMKERDWNAWDFDHLLEQGEEGVKDLLAVEKHFSAFFATKTKNQLFQRAITDRILMAPCNTLRDVSENLQLKAREFWVEIEQPGLDTPLKYLGPYIKFSESPIGIGRRAPGLGEHNEEIYVGELGLSRARLRELEALGAI